MTTDLTPAELDMLERRILITGKFSVAEVEKLMRAARQEMDSGFSCPYPRSPAPEVIQDCNWPLCGCDPKADRVIESLQEMDMLKGNDWQPIETAPIGYDGKTFRHVLFRGVSKARSFNGPVYISGWMDSDRQPVYFYQYSYLSPIGCRYRPPHRN